MKKQEFIYLFKKYFKILWPLNRSITGAGLRETHKILKQLIPLKSYEIKSGKKCMIGLFHMSGMLKVLLFLMIGKER